MSIKSEKTLKDECEEIIERAYLVRTPSDESLSGSDASDALSSELLRKLLSPLLLSRLKTLFKPGPCSSAHSRVDEVMRDAAAQEGIEFPKHMARARSGLWLDEGGFVGAVQEVFGGPKYSPHAVQLFHTLDVLHTNRMGWEQLLDRVIEEGGKRTRSRAEVWTPVKVEEMKKIDKCKRETIVKLVPIELADSFCYCVISRGGRVVVIDGTMAELNSYEVFYHRTGIHRRVKNCWVTDAVYLSDVQYLVLSSSDRSLSFYDVSTLAHSLVYCISSLPDIPTCMSYAPSPAYRLFIGTERGDVHILTFLQHRVGLFCGGDDNAVKWYYWMELSRPPHSSYATISTWRHLHSRTIRRLCHTRNGEVLLSCSHDSVASLRARYMNGKIEDYVFKVQRGITCFSHCPALHVYVTGSPDGVRVWGSPGSPARLLSCRNVIDVSLVEGRGVVMAYCGDSHLYIWDLFEECLLQSFRVRFPFLGTLGKKIEFGNQCMFTGPPHFPLPASARKADNVDENDEEDDLSSPRFTYPELLLTCCDYICRIRLTEEEVGPLVPAPCDVRVTRKPSAWDVAEEDFISSSPLDFQSLTESANDDVTVSTLDDVDTLIQKAGLEGILEKDFVLMMGLKSDLHKKLADMRRSMEKWSLTPAAPHRNVTLFELDDVKPVDSDLAGQYRKVMSLFPPPSVVSTPSTSARTRSERSTPRTQSERNTSTPRTRSERNMSTPRTHRKKDI